MKYRQLQQVIAFSLTNQRKSGCMSYAPDGKIMTDEKDLLLLKEKGLRGEGVTREEADRLPYTPTLIKCVMPPARYADAGRVGRWIPALS